MPTAEFSITSVDAALPRLLLGIEPSPLVARSIHNAGIVLYQRTESDGPARQRHTFTVEFGTENAAGLIANWLWNTLHSHVSSLEIGGVAVPVQNAEIKRALLAHATAA